MRQRMLDFELNDLRVEVKHRLRSKRDLRAAVVDLASTTLDNPDMHMCLLLVDSGLSRERLQREWELLQSIFRKAVFEHLGLASYHDGIVDLVLGHYPQQYHDLLQEIASQEEKSTLHHIRLSNPDYSGEILRLMILLWLTTEKNASDIVASDPLPYAQDKSPTRDRQGFSINSIEKSTGTTYRTVIRALDSLGPVLKQYSDRSVALTAFPRMAWEKFLVLADTSRSTKYYTDRSGQPRSPKSLMQRLQALPRQDIAIGGVAGAMRIYKDLDLVGLPRLDLHIHAPGSNTDLSFIRKLDPALKETDVHDEKPSLAIHFLRRKESYFRIDTNQHLWADPIECLIDLLTMHMDQQALQFRNALMPKDA